MWHVIYKDGLTGPPLQKLPKLERRAQESRFPHFLYEKLFLNEKLFGIVFPVNNKQKNYIIL